IKQHIWGGIGRTLRSIGREMSAHRCGRLGVQLSAAGIPTPMPRACLEYRVGPWGRRSYLITDFIEGTSLYRYIRFGSQSEEELRHVARQVANIWQRFIETGVSHNDMKPENFIVDEDLRVWVIDLEKVRLHGGAERQRRRQIWDVKNFLHIRGWHGRQAAREIFYSELAATPCGSWLDESMVNNSVDPALSVLVITDPQPDVAAIRRAIDSVRDIADEAVLVATSENGTFDVLDRILIHENEHAGPTAMGTNRFAQHPWVLMLHQNETVTPFLAKELQERISEPGGQVAVRIPIEPQMFGRSVAADQQDASGRVRLYLQDACACSVKGGELVFENEPQRTGSLTGTIQRCDFADMAEFIAHMNEHSTQAAQRRWAEGQRSAILWPIVRAIGRTLKTVASRRGIGSGWIGLQTTVLEGVFNWVEEAKLRQLCAEFAMDAGKDATNAEADAEGSIVRFAVPKPVHAAQRRAA
ncbi:MAG TPA: lipopolysaccharide kinase InaA family protein, partial [Burkholderiaceae bacterium]|nr:lipopolysaccharide kinase InaA family protein [Burkholderiaceae bacterium]